jgi:uncharacterized membrane protein
MQHLVTYQWNKKSKICAECRKWFRSSGLELEFRSPYSGHCGTAISNFVLFCCNCGMVFWFQTREHDGLNCVMRENVLIQGRTASVVCRFTRIRRHICKPGFNFSLCSVSVYIEIISCHVLLCRFHLWNYFLLKYFSVFSLINICGFHARLHKLYSSFSYLLRSKEMLDIHQSTDRLTLLVLLLLLLLLLCLCVHVCFVCGYINIGLFGWWAFKIIIIIIVIIIIIIIIIIDLSTFGVCPSNKHCPSARCAYAASALDKDLYIFAIRAVSLSHML